MADQEAERTEIAALRVHQWLPDWNMVDFDASAHRRMPKPYFYVFSLRASSIKALSGIQRRTTLGRLSGGEDLGIQRRHDAERSSEIGRFVRSGYPWSDLSETKRRSADLASLIKPGWLPTAIVINILGPDDVRRGASTTALDDMVQVRDEPDGTAKVLLPKRFTGPDWQPSDLHPIEVIDGQHRLWAFEEADLDSEAQPFELPVVAFHQLDVSWQAYLFWTINIKPKRINASLAFDLYPLLRTEDWLNEGEGLSIYQETRAQELTEILWSYPESPWYQRINMLGDPGRKSVSQAAWIRSLTSTFVKRWEGQRISIGGLFGARMGETEDALAWSRAQQGAFLVLVWQSIADAVHECQDDWAQSLRRLSGELGLEDVAFSGDQSLLNTDTGVRGVLYAANDLSYLLARTLELDAWTVEPTAGPVGQEEVRDALESLRSQPVAAFLQHLGHDLAHYDWRVASTEGITESQRLLKLTLRGGSGYREMRRQLLAHLANSDDDSVRTSASRAKSLLGL
jgi:DGQHR domain-containing protein